MKSSIQKIKITHKRHYYEAVVSLYNFFFNKKRRTEGECHEYGKQESKKQYFF